MITKRIGLAATIAIAIVLISLNAAGELVTCAWYGYQTERQTRYAPYVGCLVKAGDAWVPRSELRTQQ